MDVVLLRAGGDELAVGAPFQRDMAAAPGEFPRRQDDLAGAPHRDPAIVGAGDAAAVLAEVEVGHRALVRAEFLHLAALHHEGALARRSGDSRGRAMGGGMLEPLALLVGDLARRSVGWDGR